MDTAPGRVCVSGLGGFWTCCFRSCFLGSASAMSESMGSWHTRIRIRSNLGLGPPVDMRTRVAADRSRGWKGLGRYKKLMGVAHEFGFLNDPDSSRRWNRSHSDVDFWGFFEGRPPPAIDRLLIAKYVPCRKGFLVWILKNPISALRIVVFWGYRSKNCIPNRFWYNLFRIEFQLESRCFLRLRRGCLEVRKQDWKFRS